MMKPLNNTTHPLESLLQQHCPNGVEFKELGELCKIQTGKLNANAKVENGKYPFFTCDEIPYSINTYAFDCEAILISGNGSKVGHIHFYKGKFNAYQRTYILSDFSSIISKFLFFILNAFLKSYILTNCKKASIPYITLPMLEKFKIPIPPLEIQQKIVDILDAFTELQAELQARRKQYEYYRNKLLSFEELQRRTDMLNGGGLKLVTLGELGKISMCKRILKNQTKPSGDVPFYKIGTFGGIADSFIDSSIFNEFKQKFSYPQKGDILISASGTIGKAIIYQGENAYYQDSNIVWLKHDGKKLNNKFLFYCYQNTQWDKYASKGGTITRLYNDNLGKVQIPLPPLAVQNEIVELLDKFDTLANDLSAGLPAEIEARKKQYEYYRERLLSFIAKD
ncbi:restriction endonuclease subunit S [Campylobacter upsaliensis]|uniref:restriction endonuclease subunit S n=2 Tax=Campylobacter upsaliensis TaxID=28080 RepID=UPI0022EAE4E9|nr:restriction endonuclease subunit S [Campylobacter upsaliensis]